MIVVLLKMLSFIYVLYKNYTSIIIQIVITELYTQSTSPYYYDLSNWHFMVRPQPCLVAFPGLSNIAICQHDKSPPACVSRREGSAQPLPWQMGKGVRERHSINAPMRKYNVYIYTRIMRYVSHLHRELYKGIELYNCYENGKYWAKS